MKILRLLGTPAGLATLVVLGAILVLDWPGGVLAGIGGALTGLVAILAASQFGLLAAVPLARMRVHRVVIGVGPRLADWSTPTRSFVVRAVPVIMAVGVRAATAPVRRRMWWAALCSAVAELAVVGLAGWWAVTGGGAFAHGFAIACVAEFLHALLPSRTATGTSTGWLLFRLPWVDDEQTRELEAAPLAGQAIEAANRGDLATAERLAAQLRETYPDLRSALAARTFVLEAQGRYAEAMILAVKVAADARQQPDEAASSFAALAGLACVTVEAGQLPAEVGLSTAANALENAATLGCPGYKLNGVRALHALLRGEFDEARTLAGRAAESGDNVLGRADDLATLARAHMAAGDNQAARATITEAEKLAAWWPRVAGTRSRLEVS